MKNFDFGEGKIFELAEVDGDEDRFDHKIQIEKQHFAAVMKDVLTDEQIASVLEECEFETLVSICNLFLFWYENEYSRSTNPSKKEYHFFDDKLIPAYRKMINIASRIEPFYESRSSPNHVLEKTIIIFLDIFKRYGEVYKKEKQRCEYRTLSKEKRDYIAKNYDHLFVKIGRRDGFKCYACSSVENLEIDHKTPLIKGGDNNDENLGLLCGTCNRKKHDKDYAEFMGLEVVNGVPQFVTDVMPN